MDRSCLLANNKEPGSRRENCSKSIQEQKHRLYSGVAISQGWRNLFIGVQ